MMAPLKSHLSGTVLAKKTISLTVIERYFSAFYE
jgi:hypothetical protein